MKDIIIKTIISIESKVVSSLNSTARTAQRDELHGKVDQG